MDLCSICTYEHLNKAATYLIEAKASKDDQERYIDKINDAVRELMAAQDHEPDPEFAEKIRSLRYEVESPLFGQDYDDITEKIDKLQDLIKEARERLPKAESTKEAHEKLHGSNPGNPVAYIDKAVEIPPRGVPPTPELIAYAQKEFGIEPWAWTEEEKKDPELQRKLKECIVKVVAKLPKWCLEEKAWGQTREGVTCYNPVAVCRAALTPKK